MEDEHRNENSAGSGTNDTGASGMNTDNREPVVVAEQPACPVEEGPQDREPAGGDWGSAWNSPSGAPSQQDEWKNGSYQRTGYSGSTGTGRPDNGPSYEPAPPAYGDGQTGGQGGRPGGQQGGGPGGTNQYHTQYQAQYQRQTQIQEKNTMSTASLVMGILSLVSCCCTWIGIVFGVLGIVFALMSRIDGQMDGQAKAGLILSIIGIVLDILIIILVIFLQIFTMLPDVSLFN